MSDDEGEQEKIVAVEGMLLPARLDKNAIQEHVCHEQPADQTCAPVQQWEADHNRNRAHGGLRVKAEQLNILLNLWKV